LTTAQQLTIRCDELDLADHRVVGVDSTLVIDLVVPPDLLARR
jgi:hypothetical protein